MRKCEATLSSTAETTTCTALAAGLGWLARTPQGGVHDQTTAFAHRAAATAKHSEAAGSGEPVSWLFSASLHVWVWAEGGVGSDFASQWRWWNAFLPPPPPHTLVGLVVGMEASGGTGLLSTHHPLLPSSPPQCFSFRPDTFALCSSKAADLLLRLCLRSAC